MLKFMMIGGLLTLAACGSSGGDDDSPSREYSEDSARAARIIAQTEDLTRTSAAAMPVRGRAEYDGVVGLAFGGAPAALDQAQMIGDLELNADFGAGTVRGTMDDFNTADGRELNGELRVNNGTIAGSGFAGTATGALTGPGDAPGVVNAAIGGEFLGAGAEAVSGGGTGISTEGSVGLIFQGVRDRD